METTFFDGLLLLPARADDTDLLLRIAVKKLGRKPAENVIHDRLGHRDIGVFGETRRLETHMTELVDSTRRGTPYCSAIEIAVAKESIKPEMVEPSLDMVIKISPGWPSS